MFSKMLSPFLPLYGQSSVGVMADWLTDKPRHKYDYRNYFEDALIVQVTSL